MNTGFFLGQAFRLPVGMESASWNTSDCWGPGFFANGTAALHLADDIPMAIDVAKVHLFDAASGAPLR